MPRRFTILHTNDLHSALLGVGPSSEYTPDTLGDDVTVGGFARLATLIGERRVACQERGPVLVLDGGDYSMGTAFGAADPETGGDLRVLELMGYDATTLGNHEFDLGPDGLARSIEIAASVSGRSVAIVASNLDVESDDPRTSELRRVVDTGSVRRSLVIERDGMRFGIVGVMGEQARSCILDVAAVRFTDPVAAAAAAAAELRAEERVDVVICLSHGGLLADANGGFTIGPDVDIAQAVPDIDVVIGGHSHHAVSPPIVAPGGTPVVQAGKFGEVLGELELTRHDDGSWSATNTLHVVDDTIPGDPVVAAEVDRLAALSSELLFAVDGLRMDQPLAIASADLSNSFTDLAASGPLADLVTDAFRDATGADVALTVNGLIRAPIRRGAQGVQTVYDIFGLTPIGEGVGDTAIGTHLVVATMSPRRLAWLIELLLADAPRRPGRHVPRTSGLRYRFDANAVPLARVVSMELGDAVRGYRPLALDDDPLLTVAMPANLGSISTRARGELTLELGDIMVTATHPTPPVREWEAVVRRLQRLAKDRGGVLPVIPPPDATPEWRVIDVSART